MRKVLLEARRLCKVYPGGVAVLADAGLTVRMGDCICVLGRPGAGKSALLRILGFAEAPTSGDLLLEGRLMIDLSPGELAEVQRHEVGFDRGARPKLLLADEPGTAEQAEQLLQLHRAGQTLLFVTQYPLLAHMAPTIYRLQDGSLYLVHSPHD